MNEEPVVMNLSVPPWGRLDAVVSHTGISERWLHEMVSAGWVRKRKRGEHRQALTVFSIVDVLECLNSDSDWQTSGGAAA